MKSTSESGAVQKAHERRPSNGRRGSYGRTLTRKWVTIGLAGTAGLGVIVGLTYTATGSDDPNKPAGAAPVAVDAAVTPERMSSFVRPVPSKSRSVPHKARKKPTPNRRHKKKQQRKRVTPPAPARPTVPGGKAARYAAQVVALVNTERAKNRCGPLTVNAKLRAAAQGHSADMVRRNFFDHRNPDGKGPGERIAAVGYPSAAWAENIAYGQQTPAAVMRAWMNSPGHRTNILNCTYRAIGVGVVFRSSVPYWTQNFGSVR